MFLATEKTWGCVRCLVMDTVQNANSGHPGSAISMAPVLCTLYSRASGLVLEFAVFQYCYLKHIKLRFICHDCILGGGLAHPSNTQSSNDLKLLKWVDRAQSSNQKDSNWPKKDSSYPPHPERKTHAWNGFLESMYTIFPHIWLIFMGKCIGEDTIPYMESYGSGIRNFRFSRQVHWTMTLKLRSGRTVIGWCFRRDICLHCSIACFMWPGSKRCRSFLRGVRYLDVFEEVLGSKVRK